MTTTIRLAGLHLVSRRAPASLLALAGVAVALRVALRWTPASGASSVMFPLIVAAAAAAVISATTHSPLGEPERVTGPWLPWLRFGSGVIMAGAACGALALGAVGGHLALGAPALLRDLAGLTGIALITAAQLGAGLLDRPLADLVVSISRSEQAWRRRGYGRPARPVTGARPSAPAGSSRPDSPPSPCAAPAAGPYQGSRTTAAPCVPCWSRAMAAAASASG